MEVGVFPHRDLVSCTNMSINSTSNLALLAGRRCFAIVDLASPASLVLREARQSKWEVVCSEWSVQEERLLAVASNNKVELITCRDTELVVDAVLRSHTRAVTDLGSFSFSGGVTRLSLVDSQEAMEGREREVLQLLRAYKVATVEKDWLLDTICSHQVRPIAGRSGRQAGTFQTQL